MTTTTPRKRNWNLIYLIGSIVLLIAVFLGLLFLLTTVWKPYVWMPDGSMPEELGGGGPPLPGDCAEMFKGTENYMKPPPFGKPVDCRPLRGYMESAYYVQLEGGLILFHDGIEPESQAFELAQMLTLWLACILLIPFVFFAIRTKRKSATENTRPIP